MKFEEWVKGIENAAIKGLCSTHPNICKMIYNEGQKDIEKALKDKGVCLQSEYDELKQKVEGYERIRDRLIEMGFPNFMSCREYAEQLEELQEDLKHKKIAIQNRKARIKDLEKQIEKMKCCENCAYRTVDLLSFKPFCDKRKLEIENPLTCKCDKWKSVN